MVNTSLVRALRCVEETGATRCALRDCHDSAHAALSANWLLDVGE